MKEQGIGGVMHMQTINAGGLPLPKEPKMLDADWDAWFGEALHVAHEAGMTLSASIVDGWAHGGWWIDKENGAKQLMYSETQCDGPGKISAPLPQPFTRLDLYHDVAVVAFKERATASDAGAGESQQRARRLLRRGKLAGGACGGRRSGNVLADQQTLLARSPGPVGPDVHRAACRSRCLVVSQAQAGPADCVLQVSDDGQAFRPVTSWTMTPGENKRVEFAATTARHFRLSISRAHAPDLQLSEFQLLRQGDTPVLRPGIKWWDFKSANRAWWQWPLGRTRRSRRSIPRTARVTWRSMT